MIRGISELSSCVCVCVIRAYSIIERNFEIEKHCVRLITTVHLLDFGNSVPLEKKNQTDLRIVRCAFFVICTIYMHILLYNTYTRHVIWP